MKQLNEVADLFFSAGIPMPGVQVSQDEALRLVRERYPYCEYCLVADWRWIDLDVTKAQLAELTRTNRKPAVIYAASVIYDSQRRWDVGDFVRTSYLYKFEEGAAAKTECNT